MLAGIGIFLFGIYLLEEAIQQLSGRTFKSLIKRFTATPIKGILSGTISTAVLQSSSAVMMMVLAFAGAGLLNLSSATGVILGSNLGTTLTSWIVASIGFKIKIDSLFLPFIGVGGLGLIFLGRKPKWSSLSKLLVGFGFLFMGLDYMKSSIEGLASQLDLAAYMGYPTAIFVVLGFVLTALVQSSSAAMAIILSLLFSESLPMAQAAAMVIGTNLGTTLTVFLGGLGGPIIKKQISIVHFVFNLFTAVFCYLLLQPLLWFILDFLGLRSDPVLALALFHTIFNFIGILLFLPFIPRFTAYLQDWFESKSQNEALPGLIADVPEAGIEFYKEKLSELIDVCLDFNIKIGAYWFEKSTLSKFTGTTVSSEELSPDLYQTMRWLRRVQLDLIMFSNRMQRQGLNEEESQRLHQYLIATRYALTSCESLWETFEIYKIIEMYQDDNLRKILAYYTSFHYQISKELRQIKIKGVNSQTEEQLRTLRSMVFDYDKESLLLLADIESEHEELQAHLQSALSVNRGIVLSIRQMIVALRDFFLMKV